MLLYDDASVILKYRLLPEGPIQTARFSRIGQDGDSSDGCFRLTWKEQDKELKPTLRHSGLEDYYLETLELCVSDVDEGVRPDRDMPAFCHYRVFQNGFQSWSRTGMLTSRDADAPCRLLWKHDMDENPESPFFSRLGTRLPLAPLPAPGKFHSDFLLGLEGRHEEGHFYCLFFASSPGDQSVRYRIFLDPESARLNELALIWDFNGALFRRHSINALTPVKWNVSFFTLGKNRPADAHRSLPRKSFAELMSVTMETMKKSFGGGQGRAVRGWCSWYHYYNKISQDIILENLDKVKKNNLKIDVFQIDDGYQKNIGDWLETNRMFLSGMKYLADRIRNEGINAGIWLAPTLARPDSDLCRNQNEMILCDHAGEPVSALFNPLWGGDTLCLDTTHPRTEEYISEVIHTLVSWGYNFLKLDFMFAASFRGAHHDPRTTGAERLSRLYKLIRRAAGKKTFLLGCGSPLFPAVGKVDAMRISVDVNSIWDRNWMKTLLRDRNFPTAKAALQNAITRSAMHGRFWINDPDCLMVREKKTELNERQVYLLASVMCLSGGMLLVSDDLSTLSPQRLIILKKAFDLVQQCSRHASSALGLMDEEFPLGLYNPAGYLGIWNPSDRPRKVVVEIPAAVSSASLKKARDYWTVVPVAWEIQGHHISLPLAPFESIVAVL